MLNTGLWLITVILFTEQINLYKYERLLLYYYYIRIAALKHRCKHFVLSSFLDQLKTKTDGAKTKFQKLILRLRYPNWNQMISGSWNWSERAALERRVLHFTVDSDFTLSHSGFRKSLEYSMFLSFSYFVLFRVSYPVM